MAQIKFEDLHGTGAHFGHVTRKWHPEFKPYILMEKNGVHIIDLDETIKGVERATEFIKKIVHRNGEILFVGTKKQARDIIQQEADRCGMFYVVERWLGGTLTNFSTIKKSIKRLRLLEKEGSSIYENLTKKEIQMLNRERIKLSDQHRGIKDMRRLPDAIVVVDASFESIAVLEALRLEIPVIGIVDSNTDPTPIAYPIPANDDSIRTIQLIIGTLADAVVEVRDRKRAEKEAEKARKEAEKLKAAEEKEKAKKEAAEKKSKEKVQKKKAETKEADASKKAASDQSEVKEKPENKSGDAAETKKSK